MDSTKRGWSRPFYNSPLVQIGLIGLVCFCCPGMFSALSSLGGGGQVDHTVANNANTTLYTTFAVFRILGGGIFNILGPHMTQEWEYAATAPACWASNFFITYQFNNVNGLMFNVKTRGVKNVFYWLAQILGSIGIGYLLDYSFESRRKRGFVGLGIVALLGRVIWAGGLAS